MKEAAEIAQATEFIEEKHKKYESPIAQGGSNVSGGQKQRLSIARAIAKKPKVYIFDDSFSALDYKTDVTLRAALKEKTQDSTVIIVAQRISTILHAEQIIAVSYTHLDVYKRQDYNHSSYYRRCMGRKESCQCMESNGNWYKSCNDPDGCDGVGNKFRLSLIHI